MYVYNDFYEQNYLDNLDRISLEHTYILNNFIPSPLLLDELNKRGIDFFCAVKLMDEKLYDKIHALKLLGVTKIAVDCENYNGKFEEYDKDWGTGLWNVLQFATVIAYPEDLGGKKYQGYSAFLKELRPSALLMERTYQQWEPWNLLFFYLRTLWQTRDFGPLIYIGIWGEAFIEQWKIGIQLKCAKKISGDHVFWYSETTAVPT